MRIRLFGFAYLCCLFFFMNILVSWSAVDKKVMPTDEDAKTVITANKASFDYKRSVAVFEGNVHVVDPEVEMKSDSLTVVFDGSNDVSSVTAVGDVWLRQGTRMANCDKAIYIASISEIIMIGNVRVNDGKDVVSGRIVHLFVDDEKMTVEPGRLVIYPPDDKKTKNLRKKR